MCDAEHTHSFMVFLKLKILESEYNPHHLFTVYIFIKEC
jgi:hypothetical protein